MSSRPAPTGDASRPRTNHDPRDGVSLALSPSITHQRLLDHARPSLRFDGGDAEVWQRRARGRASLRLGLDRMSADQVALRPRMLWQRERAEGTIVKFAFTCEPGADAVAYLCLPHGSGPYPVWTCLQGHSTGIHLPIGVKRDEVTPVTVPGDRDFGLACLRLGMAALCLDQRGMGERREAVLPHRQDRETTCVEASMHALMPGRTLVAERVYDVDRAIDLLQGRREVDVDSLGVMGNSGGGLVALWAAALLRP